nr:acyl-CoA dehydrogenase [Paenibacillus lemnae]
MDRTRTVHPELLELIYEKRWFHLFVPDQLQGHMMTLPEAVHIFKECSRLDGNLGWLVTIGAGGGFFAAYMQRDTAEEVYARRDAVISGSGTPGGTAVRVPGGYRVSGSWKYSSGSTYATAFTANAIIQDDEASSMKGAEESPVVRSFTFEPHQVEIQRDWNAFGLRATESHTITVKDAFVSESRTFSLDEPTAFRDEPIYQYPFLPFAQASFAAVALGIGRHFMELAYDIIEARTSHEELMEEWTRQEKQLLMAEAAFHQTIGQSWEILLAEGTLPENIGDNVTSVCVSAAALSQHACGKLFPMLGLLAAMEDHPVNICWRDLQTACQHTLLRTHS